MVEPRSAQSAAAPASSRKGPLAHPGVLLLAGLAVLLGAYALGYLPQFGSVLEDAIRSGQRAEVPMLGPAAYGIAGLAAFLILLGLLKSVDLLLRGLRKGSPLRARPAKPVEQFLEEAAAASLSLRVARESYYLLEPHYPHRMCIALNDNLRSDLALSEEAIAALGALLRTRCDRRPAPVLPLGTSGLSGPDANCVTVLDLLRLVESAPPLRDERLLSSERAPEVPITMTPTPGRRLSDSAERKALHAATLAAIETNSLHTAQTSGLHRRASDYSGPRRRATDNRLDPEFHGPYRRAADRTSAERIAAPPLATPPADRRPSPDPAELNRRDPLFVLPRSKRMSESGRSPDALGAQRSDPVSYWPETS